MGYQLHGGNDDKVLVNAYNYYTTQRVKCQYLATLSGFSATTFAFRLTGTAAARPGRLLSLGAVLHRRHERVSLQYSKTWLHRIHLHTRLCRIAVHVFSMDEELGARLLVGLQGMPVGLNVNDPHL